MDSDLVCTTAQLMKIFGVQRRTLTHYFQDGMPKHKHGHYYLPAVVQWLTHRIKQRTGGGALDRARQELYEAQTARHNLEMAEKRGELVEFDECQGALNEVTQLIIATMDALGPRLGGVLADMDNPAEIEDVIEREIRACREEAAKRISKYRARVERRGGHHQATTEPKRRRVGRPKQDPSAGQPRTGAVAQ